METIPNIEVWENRMSAAKNPSLQPHHLDQLVNDPDEYVRHRVASHPSRTK